MGRFHNRLVAARKLDRKPNQKCHAVVSRELDQMPTQRILVLRVELVEQQVLVLIQQGRQKRFGSFDIGLAGRPIDLEVEIGSDNPDTWC